MGLVLAWRWGAPALIAAGVVGTASPASAARIVYLNLDPTTLIDTNGQNPTTNSFSSSGFTAGDISGWPALGAEQRDEYLFWLKEATYPFDITYVFSRPASGDYDMIVFGTQADQDLLFADVAGCSTPIGLGDCVDGNLHNIGFVFFGCLSPEDQGDMRRVAFHTLTALGFGWGLETLSVNGEIMGGYSVFGVEFGTSCQAVVDSQCEHEQCATGQQNSSADLSARLGARVDDGPPTLAITSPSDMEVVDPDFVVQAAVDDGFGGLDVSLEIVEAAIVDPDPEPPYQWELTSVPEGPWTLRVSVTDADGNMQTQEVLACVGACTPNEGTTTGNATSDGSAATTDDSGGSTSSNDADGSTSEEPIDPTAPLDPSSGLGPAGSACHCREGGTDDGSAALVMLMLAGTLRRRR
jgi:hypothetical protein